MTIVLPLRVYVEDTDYSGIVYHANYLKFFERARTEWIIQSGMGVAWQQENQLYFVIKEVGINYIKPAFLHDLLEVHSYITHVKPASFEFVQSLHPNNAKDKILCNAVIKIVVVSHDYKPRALPSKLKHYIAPLVREN